MRNYYLLDRFFYSNFSIRVSRLIFCFIENIFMIYSAKSLKQSDTNYHAILTSLAINLWNNVGVLLKAFQDF